MTNSATISLSMIVKNEANSLAQCLQSVQNLVQEIVIVDTGSTDETGSIAKDLGALVYHFPWCDNFAMARNEALKYVHGDWILVLDADEVLNREIVPLIQQAVTDSSHLVINLIRQEIGATQSPYSLVSRLFRNHPAIRFSRPYHAMIDDSVTQLLAIESHWRVVSLSQVAILHYGYQPQAIASLDKSNRAQNIMEKFYQQNPDDAYVCCKLGALYVQLGQLNHGLELLQHGLQSREIEAPVLFELHYHLGNVYTRLDKPNEAVKHYQAAIAQPILPILKVGAYNNLGSLLQIYGELNTALKVYQETLQIDPNFAMGYYNLGMTYKALGLFEEAIKAYLQAITINPDYASAYQNLGVIYLKLGQQETSLTNFNRAIALHDQQNPAEGKKLRQSLISLGFQDFIVS